MTEAPASVEAAPGQEFIGLAAIPHDDEAMVLASICFFNKRERERESTGDSVYIDKYKNIYKKIV